MKKTPKYIANYSVVIVALVAVVIFGCRCTTSKPTTDPLAGWQLDFSPSGPNDKIIEKDYGDYIRKLPPKEKTSAIVSGYYKDGVGQHAVKLQIGVNGTEWIHVLIYDKDNKRIKTIKYSIGHYAS